MRKLALLLLATVIPAAPALADAESAMPTPVLSAAERAVPAQLNAAQRQAYRQAFLDLEASRFSEAERVLDAMPNAALADALRAQLWLQRAPGEAALSDVTAWLSRNLDHPQADRIADIARRLGAAETPILPVPRQLRTVSYRPPMAPRSAKRDGAADAGLVGSMQSLLANDRPSDAESLWRKRAGEVSEPVRTEWAQRNAWAYYLAGDDVAAIRMATEAGKGYGEWAALGHWVGGLAAWRNNDCQRAAEQFDAITLKGASDDLAAAGAYWASRAHMACGRPQLVSQRLQIAASRGDTFYALLARRALGLDAGLDWSEPDFIKADWNHLAKIPGAKRAVALVEIGQLGLADRELRHLARVTDTSNFEALLRLSARLNLPATQYWLAHHPPTGVTVPLAARFPAPDWKPARGWRVDNALVFAHALQESNFVTDAVSHVGARGIMQLMPGTARKLSRDMGAEHDDAKLKDPSFNIEYGQTYLEELRDSVWTQGLLPKVVAAYNAGPGSVRKWNANLRDNGDPLLFIESIPFKETRHYVEVVLRNYWMYQLRQGSAPPSIDALAQGLWPRFPGLPGATAVKLDTVRTTAYAH